MPLLFCVFSGGWVSGFRHYPLCRSGRSRCCRGAYGAFPGDVQCGLSTGGRQEWWQVRPLL